MPHRPFLFDDYDPMTGPTVVVGGHVRGTPAILPITSNDLYGPAKAYHAYVTAGLAELAGQTGCTGSGSATAPTTRPRAAWTRPAACSTSTS